MYIGNAIWTHLCGSHSSPPLTITMEPAPVVAPAQVMLVDPLQDLAGIQAVALDNPDTNQMVQFFTQI